MPPAILEDELDRLIQSYAAAAGNEEPVPEWILPPRSCQFLGEVVQLFPSPRRAFEFGSGHSTAVLREVSDGATSIDHSSEWLAHTEQQCAARNVDYSEVIALRRCWHQLRPIESFDLYNNPRMLRRLQNASVILVDSPPNPAKREHALFLALQEAPAGAVIVLDDLNIRGTERFAWRLARQNKGLFRFWKLPIDHHLGIFLKIKAGPVRSFPSLREFFATWLRA